MKPLQLLHLLWLRKLLVLTVACAVVTAVTAANLLLPKTYVALASVVVDPKAVDPITGHAAPVTANPAQIATQLDVIASRNVALKVIDTLALTGDSRMVQQRPAQITEVQWQALLVADLLGRLRVHPSRDSSVITIELAHPDRELAAALANGFAEAYLQANLELKLDPARRQTTWFDEQLRALRSTLEQSQQKLSDYQRTQGIVNTDERLDVERARLDEVSRQLSDAQANLSNAQSRSVQMNHALSRGQLEQLPEIMGNSLLQNLKADLVRAQARLADIDERYGTKYPRHQSTAAEVRAIEAKLNGEIEKVRGSIEQSSQLARQQESALRSGFEEQKARVLELQRGRDQAAVLQREAENAQRAYDAALQRASAVRLESQLDLTNVAILDRAMPPEHPARPRVKLNIILAVVLGCMLGAAIAVSTELHRRRVRTSEDIQGGTGLVVLAEIPLRTARA